MTPGRVRPGTRLVQTPKTDQQRVEVLALVHPAYVELGTVLPPSKRTRVRFELAQTGVGTQVTDTWSVDLPGPGFLHRAVGPLVSRPVEEKLSRLKVLLGGRTVQLQDGCASTHVPGWVRTGTVSAAR